MSNNNLSSGELFICKVATAKHHITSALFKCSPSNAQVKESEEIPEHSRTEGSQVHFKILVFWEQPLSWLKYGHSEWGQLSDGGCKSCANKWFCHKNLFNLAIPVFEGVLVHMNIVNQSVEGKRHYRMKKARTLAYSSVILMSFENVTFNLETSSPSNACYHW